MFCYQMKIAFNGTGYAGWQRQPGLSTVQQAVEETLQNIFQEKNLSVTSGSRTDSGVHALDMTLSFHTEKELALPRLTSLLEHRLPHSIRLRQIRPVSTQFNANRDAIGKAYVYVIHPGKPNLFLNHLCWNWLNLAVNEEVRQAVKRLPGTHDFRSFTGCRMEANTVRTIYRTEWVEFGPLHCFYLSGSGFLYKMVRRLTGFLYETAQGKHSADDLVNLLNRPVPPADDAVVAPPSGLYLKKIFYDPDEWQKDQLTCPPFLELL